MKIKFSHRKSKHSLDSESTTFLFGYDKRKKKFNFSFTVNEMSRSDAINHFKKIAPEVDFQIA